MARPATAPTELAAYRDGALALAASDEFFGPKERLLLDGPPQELPGEYTERGKRVDGWETRRVRHADARSDWCVVRLAVAARLERARLDTRGFRWNAPTTWWLEGCDATDAEVLAGPEALTWTSLLGPEPVEPDAAVECDLSAAPRVTHVRLWIDPDGGVARLGVRGHPVVDLDEQVDRTGRAELAATPAGGRVVASSDEAFASAGALTQLVGPATPGEGWETRRRRQPGTEWVVIQLAAEAAIDRIEVDTAHFIGNAPREVAVDIGGCASDPPPEEDGWREDVGRLVTRPHARQWLAVDGSVRGRYVRLRLVPDGGLSRVAVQGRLTAEGWAHARLTAFNAFGADRAHAVTIEWCPSSVWGAALAEGRPYGTVDEIVHAAEAEVAARSDDEVLAAANAHPRIGAARLPDRSEREQAEVHRADDALRERLASEIARYEEAFGFRFLVDAPGRTAEALLEDVSFRLAQDGPTELQRMRAELTAITRRRIREWFAPPHGHANEDKGSG